MTVDLPLSVWATAQTHVRQQRIGRYVPESGRHPGRMLPAIARAAITAYTAPGDLVLDPMCGVGTTLVEAVHLGRDTLGVEYEPEWADIARANLEHASAQGATGRGEVITGDALHLPDLVDGDLCGKAAMVLTSPPYGASVHGQAKPVPGGGVIKSYDRYSKDRANLAHQPLGRLLSSLASILAACEELLRPGGVVAVTARPYRRFGELVDLPAAVLRCGDAVGLTPYERNIALLAGLREDRLVPRASFFALDQVRRARRSGRPLQVIAHEDVLVFRRPDAM
jgi:modification methylase